MDATSFDTPPATTLRFCPLQETSLRLENGATSKSKKRKRSENLNHNLQDCSFIVKPYPANPSIKPRTMQPLLLLPRSCLPLSCLDISSSAKVLGQTRLFEANIKILGLEERLSSQPTVLVASYKNPRNLFVLERESRGLYTLLQLGSWVDLERLRDVAVSSKPNYTESSSHLDGISLGNLLDVQKPDININKIGHKKRIAIETLQSMIKKSSTLSEEKSLLQINDKKPMSLNEKSTEDMHLVTKDPVESMIAHSLVEIFDAVRLQYYDTLYLSRASLAYFAKGPLSRARAALQNFEYDNKDEFKRYIALLETLIMPTALIDKKYREGIPSCIELVDAQEDYSDGEADTRNDRKKKSKKKLKLGKNGLFPGEDILIRKWWISYKENIDFEVPGSAKDMLFKAHISQLRIRETQLQMILILEVLALHPLALPERCDKLKNTSVSNDLKPIKQKLTLKDSGHLANLIDIHIDRLCIWETVALDSLHISGHESQKLFEISHESIAREKPDENLLRDFYVEVIMPFFSSRIPDQCAVISRNLGDLTKIPPSKSKSSRSTKALSKSSRIGAAAKRPNPATFTHSLKRVLTDDRERRSTSRGPNKALALMKSATMPIMLGSKGGDAEVLMPINISKERSFKAGDQKSDQFSTYVKDNNADHQINLKANRDKQKFIETELTDAISILKKPNRELVAKEFIDSAERRLASSSYSNQSKMTAKKQASRAVQISATPKKSSRNKNVQNSQCVEGKPMDIISPSFETTIKSRFDSPFSCHDSTRDSFLSVQATPTRKSLSKDLNFPGKSEELLSSSPFSIRRSSAQLFCRVSESATVDASVTRESSHGIMETPVKKRMYKLDYQNSSANSENINIDYSSVGNIS
ncbi:hypothetical protein K3495_g8388 [Podosphaera aphanis]|nr:hypothetical protein K3495_g8388 [Podosphaera aphanis]